MAPMAAGAYYRGMAEIIYLEADQSPPEQGVWLLLKQGPDGLYAAHSQFVTGEVNRRHIHTDRWPLVQAIEKAQADAVAHGIPTIYVRQVD
jgi:hypothetical protein